VSEEATLTLLCSEVGARVWFFDMGTRQSVIAESDPVDGTFRVSGGRMRSETIKGGLVEAMALALDRFERAAAAAITTTVVR
jgi:hypothetical protein